MKIFDLNVNNFCGPDHEKDWQTCCKSEEQKLQDKVLGDVISKIDVEKPDIIVFQEFDVNAPAGKKAVRRLGERKYRPVYPNQENEISGNYSITMIFVKEIEVVPDKSPEVMKYRWCVIKIGDLTTLGVHAPLENKYRKPEDVQKFFDALKNM